MPLLLEYRKLEYHKNVNRFARRSVPASLALFGTFLFSLFPVVGASAQFNGGSGASSAHSGSVSPPTANFVAPPTGSVSPPTGAFVHNGTSFVSGMAVPTSGRSFSGASHFPGSSHTGNDGRHHPHHSANGTAYYPYVYALPVPYAVDVANADNADNNDDEDDDANYQGGPTIFDRRGLGAESYIPPVAGAMSDSALAHVATASALDPPQPPTTLVFRDGHQVEVGNYAIVSTTLYDLTPGHPRKIALADLDLSATQKQNEDHGVVFQLPPSAQAN